MKIESLPLWASVALAVSSTGLPSARCSRVVRFSTESSEIVQPQLGTLGSADVDERDLSVEDVDVVDVQRRDLAQLLGEINHLGRRAVIWLGSLLGSLVVRRRAGGGRRGVEKPDLRRDQLDGRGDVLALFLRLDHDLGPFRLEEGDCAPRAGRRGPEVDGGRRWPLRRLVACATTMPAPEGEGGQEDGGEALQNALSSHFVVPESLKMGARP